MVIVYKAQPVGDRKVPDLEIIGREPAPEYQPVPDQVDNYLERLADFHGVQADLIAKALMESLPGGTLDRLIGKLLMAKASHFIVPWGKPS